MKQRLFLPKILCLCFLSFLTAAILTSCGSNGYLAKIFGRNLTEEMAAEYLSIGDTYAGMKKYEEALKNYEMAGKHKTFANEAMYKIARTNALAENWDAAQEMYEKLLKRDKNNFSLQMSLAYVSALSGDVKAATKQYKKLAEENPDSLEALENYIALLLLAENFPIAEARQKISWLEEKFPESSKIKTFKEKLPESEPEKEESAEAE